MGIIFDWLLVWMLITLQCYKMLHLHFPFSSMGGKMTTCLYDITERKTLWQWKWWRAPNITRRRHWMRSNCCDVWESLKCLAIFFIIVLSFFILYFILFSPLAASSFHDFHPSIIYFCVLFSLCFIFKSPLFSAIKKLWTYSDHFFPVPFLLICVSFVPFLNTL